MTTRPLLAQLEHTARSRPDAVAIECEGERWSYAALLDDARRRAQVLTDAGIGPGDLVALRMPRGPALAAGVFGCWLAGAAYLPLDPAAPAQRIEWILASARPRCVLGTDPALLRMLDDGATDTDGATLTGTDLAYAISTSGSTGDPKTVEITHSALENLITHLRGALDAGPHTRMLWVTQFSFDMSVPELFLPLAAGGTVVVADDEARADGAVLARSIEVGDPQVLQATPSTWRLALEGITDQLRGRVVMIGGEASTPDLIAELLDRGARVLHCYGPTETTVWSTMGWLASPPRQPVPVGRPITATTIACCDERGVVVPDGDWGEVWIGGAGVARGYRHRPDLTGARFVAHPDLGRAYRTGDLGRWGPDGQLELRGRIDRQVKVRGNRIELGDVEAAVCRHPGVRGAAVELIDAAVSPRLAAAVVVNGLDEVDLLAHCREQLPSAFVPSTFRIVRSLPLNANDKVDHDAVRTLLEEPAAASRTAPLTSTTDGAADWTDIAGIWQELLPCDVVTADTHFFLAGGHSLLAALSIQRIEKDLGLRLSLNDLFDHPTPKSLAAWLAAGESGLAGAR